MIQRRQGWRGVGVLLTGLIVAGAGAACGRKGPPLPPLRPVPAAVVSPHARRVGNHVELRFTIPSANRDGTKPISISRVDIYARSVPEGTIVPGNDIVMDKANLVGSVKVRPPDPDDESTPPPTRPGTEPAAAAPAAKPAKRAAAPDPAADEPGAGEPAMFVDAIPSEAPKPLPPPKGPPPAPSRVPLPAGAVPAAPVIIPDTRYFIVVGVSANGRPGAPAAIAVPLTPAPAPPLNLEMTNDETTITAAWTSPAAGQLFQVYDVDQSGREITGVPLTPAPVAAEKATVPVVFDKERCLAVRAVSVTATASVESQAVMKCVTPKDVFPPPAPAGFRQPVAEAGAINLSWDPVEAPDLGGYLVLRGEGADGRLQQLTSAPIAQTTYRDEANLRPGVTYVYVIVAVDKATPPNRSANSAPRSVVAQ